MATVVTTEDRTRNISITEITQAEMNAVIEAGIEAVFGAALPADFALDADDQVEVFAPSGRIFARSNDYAYSIAINETD